MIETFLFPGFDRLPHYIRTSFGSSEADATLKLDTAQMVLMVPLKADSGTSLWVEKSLFVAHTDEILP